MGTILEDDAIVQSIGFFDQILAHERLLSKANTIPLEIGHALFHLIAVLDRPSITCNDLKMESEFEGKKKKKKADGLVKVLDVGITSLELLQRKKVCGKDCICLG